MRKRLLYSTGTLLLAILVGLVVWQTSFSFGDFRPSSPEGTLVLWGVSTLIFILTVTLSFMLARNFIKLWVERHRNREGSRIRTKLVLGALVLTITPVVFLVVFSIGVLNRNLDKWFTQPAEDIKFNLITVGLAIDREGLEKAKTMADWVSTLPETQRARNGEGAYNSLQSVCVERGIASIVIESAGKPPLRLCEMAPAGRRTVEVRRGDVVLSSLLPLDLAETQRSIRDALSRYSRLKEERNNTRNLYIQLLTLIALFILFVATWLALFLARQISVPISALLGAAEEVRRGNLGFRVEVNAIDELATLVRAFNEMTRELESNGRELEKRRRFTEAILESIPTGVISVTADGRIQAVNRALQGLFPAEKVESVASLRDLFQPEDLTEIRYLMNRARRLGVAASQIDVRREDRVLHLSLTIAALEDRLKPGFVLVLEDTTDMLRAQKAAAWHEVARRIAHEIKNPLTPIALCAERIGRQLDRASTPDTLRILRECSQIICSEVESVRTLVDEFTQFARFPSAQPVPSDLNEVVENALAVFAGRLTEIEVIRDLSPALPQVQIDREQFKRLVVNLVDNAAEAMRASLVKRLYIGTSAPSVDSLELTIADTGCGISPEDRERLFLPYFTTKSRGTGLGLAIVSHIVSEHGGQIRVEDNNPVGARFIVELPVVTPADLESQKAEVSA
jgi:PAS domain S-box-containing protein